MPRRDSGRTAVNSLEPGDAARLINRLQELLIPAATEAGTLADLLRINDTVKRVADDQLEFFDVPADFLRVMKERGS
jgi:hypothetical protein